MIPIKNIFYLQTYC